MKLVEQSIEITRKNYTSYDDFLKMIETVAKTCTKARPCKTMKGTEKFVNKLLNQLRHNSILEHAVIQIHGIVPISLTRELFRHRHISPTESSTRYITMGKNEGEVGFVTPAGISKLTPEQYDVFIDALEYAEKAYLKLGELGIKNDFKREILPLLTRSEFFLTTNLREMLSIIKLRTGSGAHDQIRELFLTLKYTLKKELPVLFGEMIYQG